MTNVVHNGFGHESTVNKSVEWYTPPWLFEGMGLNFDLDPCHPQTKLSWIPVKETYSLPQDGLELPWKGTVWLNPPYGPNTGRWLKRLNDHKDGITIVFSRTDTHWYHDYVCNADAILFLKSRVKFCDATGFPAAGSPGCGSLLAAWGEKAVEALKALSKHGFLVLKNDDNNFVADNHYLVKDTATNTNYVMRSSQDLVSVLGLNLKDANALLDSGKFEHYELARKTYEVPKPKPALKISVTDMSGCMKMPLSPGEASDGKPELARVTKAAFKKKVENSRP